MTDNLALWGRVEKTDPAHTKPANIGGNRITSISPQYQILNATTEFGPYGKAWGFKAINLDYTLSQSHDIVTATFDFFHPGGEFQIINSIKLFKDNAKTKIDDEFAKKIETDALTKALSKLGFNADVFMGRFDDTRYVQEVAAEFEAKREPTITKGKQDAITKALADAEYPLDGFLKTAQIKSLQEITESRFSGAMDHIKQVGESVND